MKRIRDMTTEEIRHLMHDRIRPCWRRLPAELAYTSTVLDYLWRCCWQELERREAMTPKTGD